MSINSKQTPNYLVDFIDTIYYIYPVLYELERL